MDVGDLGGCRYRRERMCHTITDGMSDNTSVVWEASSIYYDSILELFVPDLNVA
jgi:hypothetical protein